MPKRNNLLLLQDILEAGNKILRYTKNYSFNNFKNDERTTDALIRNFEITGEALRRLTKDFTDQHPEISWRELVSYRNLLIHEYCGISLKTVWDIIETDFLILSNKLNH